MTIIKDIDDFIFPVFIYENKLSYQKSLDTKYLVNSRVHLNDITKYMEQLLKYKIKNVLLFGVPKRRDFIGVSAFKRDGVIQKSVKTLKENFGTNLNVICDVCICQYNTTGHCGIVKKSKGASIINQAFSINNDKTLKLLGLISLSLSEIGTNFVAPSSMMDGQVFYIKNILRNHGFKDVKIMSYSSKHNSNLYSPFRNSNYFTPKSLDKSSYQNNFYNFRESIREVILDEKEGADWLMVKPSLWYMDIIRKVKDYISKPLVVQNVSGEYYLVKSLSDRRWINESEWYISYINSLKRAGANKFISYFLVDFLKSTQNR